MHTGGHWHSQAVTSIHSPQKQKHIQKQTCVEAYIQVQTSVRSFGFHRVQVIVIAACFLTKHFKR